MIRRPPRSTRTDTLFPYTTLFRSHCVIVGFGLTDTFPKWVFDYETLKSDPQALQVENVNPYLVGGPNLLLPSRTTAQAGMPERSEEHTSELQSLMRISYAVFCLKKKTHNIHKQRQLLQT